MRAFLKSVAAGSLAGAGPVLIFTMLLAVVSLPEGINGPGSLLATLWLAILPLVVSAPIVLVASIVIGLPLTYVLHRQNRESAATYIGWGAAFGFIIPIVVLIWIAAQSGYWIALLGAASGGITGRTWWISARQGNVSYPD